MPLEDLIAQIGQSVQSARHQVDVQAVRLFYSEFTQSEDGNEVRWPLSWTLALPTTPQVGGESRTVNVPTAALMHHSALQLATVDIDIPILASQDGQQILIAPTGEHQEGVGRLQLHFAQSDPTEGVARVVQSMTNIL